MSTAGNHGLVATPHRGDRRLLLLSTILLENKPEFQEATLLMSGAPTWLLPEIIDSLSLFDTASDSAAYSPEPI